MRDALVQSTSRAPQNVRFLLPFSKTQAPSTSGAIETLDGTLRLAGQIEVRAYAHSKLSVAEMIAALISDARRSLLERYDILDEDLQERLVRIKGS